MAMHNSKCFSKPIDDSDTKGHTREIIPQNYGADDHMSLNFCVNVEAENLPSALHDFGRESLGILPINFGDMSNPFRDSLGFRSNLNIPECREDSLDCGKESLGILQLSSLDARLEDGDTKAAEIMPAINESTTDLPNIFETAFFLSPSQQNTATFTSPSYSGNPLRSWCLEEPSKIYALKSNTWSDREFGSPFQNSYFGVSNVSSVPSALNNGMISNSAIHFRTRIQSLPGSLNVNTATEGIFNSKAVNTQSLPRKSFHETPDFEQKENMFIDSVFIDGSNLANKIADGSILNDLADHKSGILDSTPQPIWPDDLNDSEIKEPEVMPATDTVFKLIDKAMPKTLHPISEIKPKRSESIGTPNKSKNAKEILENLSEMLNCTHLSDFKKSEGQNLLSDLAEILQDMSNSKIENLDDSGHSSFIDPTYTAEKDQQHECIKVLKEVKALELSLQTKSIIEVSKKRLSQSFSSATPSTTSSTPERASLKNSSVSGVQCTNMTEAVSNPSSGSNDKNMGSENIFGSTLAAKLKPKPGVNIGGTKKGPMKAVIPVKEMKKGSLIGLVTPEKLEQKTSDVQSAKPNTPLNEARMKPMAASTPTTKSTRLKYSALSPLTGRSQTSTNLTRDKSNISPITKSIPKLIENKPIRRGSVSEMKEPGTSSKLKRSNSTGKETRGIMASLSKVRENLRNSPYYGSIQTSPLTENNDSIEWKKLDGKTYLGVSVKPRNLSPKLRKVGKENISK